MLVSHANISNVKKFNSKKSLTAIVFAGQHTVKLLMEELV